MAQKTTKLNRWSLVDQGLLSLFLTFSLIELTNRGSGIIDGLFVSRFLDAQSIAAVGVAKTIYSLIGIVAGLFTVGTQSRCAHDLGRGDVNAFRRSFSAMFTVATAASLAFAAVMFFGARQVAFLFGASGKGAALIDGAAAYLRGIAVGIPPLVLAPVLSSVCQLDSAGGRVRRSGLVFFAGNCALDYALLKAGMGVFGVGLATSAAMYAQLFYLLLHFRQKERMLRFVKFRIGVREVFEVLSQGTERALRSLGNFISPTIVNRIIIYFGGTLAMSAFSIQKDLISFAEIFAAGLADATALQAGVFYGEMNGETLQAMGRSAQKYCMIFLGGISAVLLLFCRPIASIYAAAGSELWRMIVFSAIATAVYAPLNGLVRPRISYLNAVKRKWNMQIMTFLSSVVYTVLSALLLGSLFGAYGVLAADVLRALLLLATVWLYYAVKTKRLFPRPYDYLSLPENFALGPGDVISLDIRDRDDVSLVSEQIQLFCRGHKLPARTGVRAAVCFEELSLNTIEYGFPHCKKQPGIDLRVVFTDDSLILRLRDNCPAFDVERRIAQKISEAEDPAEAGLGLSLIAGLADNIRYVHSLDNNNVILRFPLADEAAAAKK